MKKILILITFLLTTLTVSAASLGGGTGTIDTLDQFTATTSPSTAITQRTWGKAFRLSGQSTGCAQFDANGILTSSGSACGSGGGSGGGTWSTTTSQVSGTLINYPNNTSDVVVIGSNATTTAEYYFDPNTLQSFLSGKNTIQYASSTALTVSGSTYLSGLAVGECLQLTTGGLITTSGAACGSGSGTFSFTPTTNFGQSANSTSTQLWLRGSPVSLSASSTSQFDYATTTALTVSGSAYITPLTSALILTGADGKLAEYAGTTCTNQFVRILSALGVATCESVSLSADVTGTLGDGSLSSNVALLNRASQSFTGAVNNFIDTIASQASTSALSITGLTGLVYSNGTTKPATVASADVDYQVPLTFGDGLTRTVNDVDCDTASGSVFGCLSSANWTTFNGKENALTFSWPLIRATNDISYGGLSTSTDAVIGSIPYFTGVNTFGNVATGTVSGGTGISVTAGQSVIGSGLTITNSAPDQTVVLTDGTGISTSGTYPNFTITNSLPALFSYLFPSNATTTHLSFNGGASTTNLTVSGSAYFATTGGSIGIGTTSPAYDVSIAKRKISLNSGQDGNVDTVSSTTAMPVALSDLGVTVSNGHVYVLGGDSGTAVSTVYYAKLNGGGTIGTWTTDGNMPAARRKITAEASNGYIYSIGSQVDNDIFYAKVQSDGSVGPWTTSVNPLPVTRYSHVSLVANGFLYVFGGHDGGGAQSTVYYAKLNSDGSNGPWKTTTAMSGARFSPQIAQSNGYVYIMGGSDGATNQDSVLYAKLNLDGTVGAWGSTTAIPTALFHGSALASNGYIYLLGGLNAAADYTDIIYSSKINSNGTIGAWATSASVLPAAIGYQSSVLSNGYLYTLGGIASGPTTQSVVSYTSTARTLLSGALDLSGLNNGSLSEGGSAASSIYAGDIFSSNNLNVMGNSQLWGGLGVNGIFSLNASTSGIQNLPIFTVKNATGTAPILTALYDGKIGIGTTSPLSLFSVGTAGNAFRVDTTGTVKEGIWNGSTLGVAYGGTGMSSPGIYGTMLVSDGAGNWDTRATSSLKLAGGDNTYVQFSNNGDLAGVAGLTFTSGTGILATQNLTVSAQSTTSQQYITSLATPAGAFLAVDPNGLVISTTTPAGSGTPGGSPTEIQYNNGGAFGGISTFLTDGMNVAIDGGNFGIGSTTPFAPLSLGANNPTYTYIRGSLPDNSEFLNLSITSGNPTLQLGVVGAGTAQLNVDGNIAGNWNGNTIASTLGGTGLTSNTAGSLLVGSLAGGNAWTAYATTSLGGFLSQNYTTGMPTWTATSTLGLNFANIGGTLGVAKGGTGATTFTAGALLYGAGTGVVQTVATTTLTATSPLALSNAISVIGSTPSALSLGTVTYDLGGTGQTTWAQGDMLYASAANTLGKLTVGSNGECLTSNGTIPVWGACGAGTQTPWAQAIDGGGFALTNAGAITGTSLTATSTSLVSYIRNALSLGTTTVNTATFDIFGNSTTTGRSLQITDSASTTLLSVDNTGSTTITQLIGGALSADYDAGVMSLFDMPIASTTSAVGTQFSASLGINGTSTLTVYAEKSSATAATTYRDRIGIGTTTPQRLLHLSAGGAGTGTTTIKMDKIQFEGGNSAGTLTCVYIVGTSFVVQAGACPASSE